MTAQLGPTKFDVHDKPWKYVGYRGYSEFLSSDNDILILRRFDSSHARILLSLQDKISHLEQTLSEFDEYHSKKESADFNNGTLRNDLPLRSKILDELTDALNNYDLLMIRYSTLQKYPAARVKDIESIATWHKNYGNRVIAEDEVDYLKHPADLISLIANERSPVHRLIERSSRLRTLSIWKDPDRPAPPHGSEEVLYFSVVRLERFASLLIVIVGVAMLLTPIWILQALKVASSKLIVISIFVFVFLMTMSFTMVAKPFEALGATAAYAAVLMVFLQLGQAD